MAQSGVAYTHVPGEIQYIEMPIKFSDEKYYKPRLYPTIFLANMGQIVGGRMGEEQTAITLESMVVDNSEFDFLTHNPEPTLSTTFATGSLAAGTYGVPKIYTVADASIFKPYNVALNTNTNEQFLIIAINTSVTPQEITAYPAFFQTGFNNLTSFGTTALTNGTSSNNTNGDTLLIIGNAQPEGGTLPDISDTTPVRTLQYCQIIRDAVGVTSSYQASKFHGKESLNDMIERKKSDFLVNYERALILGKINKQTISGKPVRSMQGLRQFPSTNVYAATALVGGGTDLTSAKLDQLAEIAFRTSLTNNKKVLCPATVIRKLRLLMTVDTTTMVEVSDKTFGLKALRYETSFGALDFVHHPLFDTTDLADEILIVEPDFIQLGHLATQEMRYYPDEQAPGEKAQKGSWYSEASVLIEHEASIVRVTGLSLSFT